MSNAKTLDVRKSIIRWIGIPLILFSGILLLTVPTDGGALELLMIFPALAGTVIFLSARSRPGEERRFEDLSTTERLLLIVAAILGGSGMWLLGWKNPYIQYYLHRFDPIETALGLCLTLGGLFWLVNNAPRKRGDD
jgi:hypothetical protein